MTRREWLSATWAEWCPTFERGRVYCGPLIFTTRKALGRTFWAGIEVGRDWERRGIEPLEPEPLAAVLPLRRA